MIFCGWRCVPKMNIFTLCTSTYFPWVSWGFFFHEIRLCWTASANGFQWNSHIMFHLMSGLNVAVLGGSVSTVRKYLGYFFISRYFRIFFFNDQVIIVNIKLFLEMVTVQRQSRFSSFSHLSRLQFFSSLPHPNPTLLIVILIEMTRHPPYHLSNACPSIFFFILKYCDFFCSFLLH